MKDWYKEWFGSASYLSVYQHRDETDAKKIIDLILKTISLPKQSKILDAACGAGRHSNYLSTQGYEVTGFDLSKTLLKIGMEDAREKKINYKYICADLRSAYFKSRFNLVVNLFTSFGYFESDEENFRFFKNAYEMLEENGYYILDYLNEEYVRKNLIESSDRQIDNIQVIEKRRIIDSRVIKEISLADNYGERSYIESVQLYSREKLEKVCCEVGYKVKHIFGDYTGSQFKKESSPRLILFLQK